MLVDHGQFESEASLISNRRQPGYAEKRVEHLIVVRGNGERRTPVNASRSGSTGISASGTTSIIFLLRMALKIHRCARQTDIERLIAW